MKIVSSPSGFINFSSLAIMSCVSTSNNEPIAISNKRLNSISLFLLHPSAILDGTETAALVFDFSNQTFLQKVIGLIIDILVLQALYHTSKFQVF